MQGFHQYNYMALVRFFFAFLEWVSKTGNLARIGMPASLRTEGLELYTTYTTAIANYEKPGRTEDVSLHLKAVQAQVINWLERSFIPFMWDNIGIVSDEDLTAAGYHARPAHVKRVEGNQQHITLGCELPGMHDVRLHPVYLDKKFGLPEHAEFAELQERTTSVKHHYGKVDKPHLTDMQVTAAIAKQADAALSDDPAFLADEAKSEEEKWVTIGHFSRINTGIRLLYTEDDFGTERQYRARWGNHRGYSDWSQVAIVSIN